MSFSLRTAVLVTGFVFSACQCQRPYNGAGLAVTITVEDKLVASCVVLELYKADGAPLDKSQATRVAGKHSYLFGVTQGVCPPNVKLKARAMNGADGCKGTLTAVFDGLETPAAFVAGEVTKVTLPLVCLGLAEKCDDGV